jgi:hypothetical protein
MGDLDEGYLWCPVCHKAVSPGRVELCEHFLGTVYDGDFLNDNTEFSASWGSLCGMVGEVEGVSEQELSAEDISDWADEERKPLSHSQYKTLAVAFEEAQTDWFELFFQNHWDTFHVESVVQSEGMLSGSGMYIFFKDRAEVEKITGDMDSLVALLKEFEKQAKSAGFTERIQERKQERERERESERESLGDLFRRKARSAL